MKPNQLILAVLATVLAFSSGADVLELKDGKVLTGNYLGGTSGTVRFETVAGPQVIETGKALALTFTGGEASASAPPVVALPATAPTPAATGSVVVPAGTMLLVRMVDGASSRDPMGKRFTTTLETDLVVNGVMVAKAGSRVYGRIAGSQQAGRYVGRSALDLRLSELTVGGVLVPIATGPYVEAGQGSLGKTTKTTAAGAAIGAIAGDAGKGAAIGATASGLKRGQTVGVGPGELLQFTLQQPVTIKS
ncbi:MAG: hypothetical protein KIS67_26555 [Verrucomicrobiae bacterium]|nr:hypothetical protein [Verrucomicrobiae bacterium]